jgi:hypothetical protein
MSKIKFGWLAALVALAAVVGAVAVSPRAASAGAIATVTKNCVGTGTVNVFTCTLVITPVGGNIGGLANTAPAISDTYTVTATGPITIDAATAAPSMGTLQCPTSVTSLTATGYVVQVSHATGTLCNAAGATLTVTETVTVTGPVTPQTGGTAVTQSVVSGFAGGAPTVATATGLFHTTPSVNPAPTSVTKSCTTAAIAGQPAGTARVGQPISCTVTATFATATGLPAQTANVTSTNATPATAQFPCPAATSPCVFTETVTPTLAGTVPTQAIVIGGTTFTPLLTGINSVIAGQGATGTVLVTKSIVDASGNPAAGTRSGFVFTVNCGSGASATSGQGTSDANGVATINNVPAGNCTISESAAAGFTLFSIIPANVTSDIGNGGTINVPAGQTLNVAVRNIQGQAPTDATPLFVGCNNVTLTWASGTPITTVAAAITPGGVLDAIWRFDAAQGRFFGFSSNPNAPSDYTTVGVRLEAVFVCVRQAATLNRPQI